MIPSWELTAPFRECIKELDDTGNRFLRRGYYSDAQTTHEIRLKLIIDRQKIENKRLHKGSPLFKIGICLIAKEQQLEALPFLLQAYVEDILSGVGIDAVRVFPAYSILTAKTGGYTCDEEFLRKLETFTLQSGTKNSFDHETFFAKFLRSQQLDAKDLGKLVKTFPAFTFNKYSMEAFPPGPKEQRVFVGGTYGNYAMIKMIETAVYELGFQPIIADQFKFREGISDKENCFELLRNSAFAVFEISVPNGWQLEVEHASTKEIPLLCLYQGDKPSRLVSSMLSGYRNSGWKTYEDLVATLRDFLTPADDSFPLEANKLVKQLADNFQSSRGIE